MPSLVAFEFKKIVARRVTHMATMGLFVLLVLIMALNIAQQTATDAAGNAVSGPAAIALEKERAEAHAGAVTEERAIEAIRAYQALLAAAEDAEAGDAEAVGDAEAGAADATTDGSAGAEAAGGTAGASAAQELLAYEADNTAYLGLVMRPWMTGYEFVDSVAPRIDTSGTVPLYAQVAASVEAEVEGNPGTWEYTPAEQEYWLQKYADTEKPAVYGYADGWADILSCIDFLFLAIVAACVAAAPVFAGEYQERTAAVVLATRHGKGRLVAAKLAASFLFSTCVYALFAAVVVGVPLAFFGADGAQLPLQGQRLSIPYSATMAQAVGICLGIGWAITLGMTAFALFLSARLRSQLAIFASCIAVVMLPVFLPTLPSSLANHALQLLPLNGLNYVNLFSQYVSYAAGPVVLDLQSALVAAYAVVLALAVPLAARAFRRHQVL